MDKKCVKCFQIKDETLFYKNGSRRQSRCKQCFLSSKQKEYQIEYAKSRLQRFIDMVNSLKQKPCLDCNREFPPVCMDFDHREGETKVANVSHLVRLKNKNKILEEIKKCDLVCACCHRIRTQNRLLKNKTE